VKPLDWTTLFAAFREAFEWSLDIARAFARNYPDEVAAIERVRAFMRKRIAGELAHIRFDDVLFAVGLMVGALERVFQPIRPKYLTVPA
jgi:hypothetical protein